MRKGKRAKVKWAKVKKSKRWGSKWTREEKGERAHAGLVILAASVFETSCGKNTDTQTNGGKNPTPRQPSTWVKNWAAIECNLLAKRVKMWGAHISINNSPERCWLRTAFARHSADYLCRCWQTICHSTQIWVTERSFHANEAGICPASTNEVLRHYCSPSWWYNVQI